MKTKKYSGRKVATLLALAVIGLLSTVVLKDFIGEFQSSRPAQPSKIVFSYCDVAAACSTHLQEGTVELLIEPASMPVLRPLDVVVTLTGMQARKVTLEFAGRDMPMGLEPVLLTRNGYGQGKERYTGVGTISFCTTDEDMVWMARINITTKTEVQTIVFELDTSRT